MGMRRWLRAVVVSSARPVWTRLRVRMEHIATVAAEAETGRLRVAVEAQRAEQAADTGRRLEQLSRRLDDLEHQLWLMSAQVAATDERIGGLERPGVDLSGTDRERDEARRLIEEIRTEHGRARTSLSAIAFYEERISRLERRAHDAATNGASADHG
ncbi:hypothetical protein ACVGVM_15075 [Pseudonocardia bannensis]|uniref:Uncharacterized protein n=1 Tax=Pseudonocardia bannensis TaxID=630973 RepID=A0A848DSQ8_9PSEU|nr:hypothetical protein [Pseudonocardia bannensis]NMH95555.1 hypothetical protein [Pseudonocardia bannensis]